MARPPPESGLASGAWCDAANDVMRLRSDLLKEQERRGQKPENGGEKQS